MRGSRGKESSFSWNSWDVNCFKNMTLPERTQQGEHWKRPMWLPFYTMKQRWGRRRRHASLWQSRQLGWATAKPLLNIHRGQSLAVPPLCQSAASGFLIKAVCARWSQVTVVTGERSRVGDLGARVWGPDLSEVDRHSAMEGGGGSCQRGPQISSRKDWGCPVVSWKVHYKK